MKCVFQLSVGKVFCLLALCITPDAFPYKQSCSDCLPDDEECLLKCVLQNQETNDIDSMLLVSSNRKRYQHQLRFGKRSSDGITGQPNILDEAFRPQLRFGKRSNIPSKRAFMSHIRFGKRDFQLENRPFLPQGMFGRVQEGQASSGNSPSIDTGISGIPRMFCNKRQEKRFRPQGRFGKRLNPSSETINDDNDIQLYTGKFIIDLTNKAPMFSL
ncbi:uncharacterized protein LOC132558246 [Ylistrum balloti]|uniref:uncharacterized protein LOC132558246 n=1 Tax=Ylistrum balloti TaxID=509963 RepID=UPI002905920B|nr:uncharacterized protein LOC132558246 [Ylistrum balloti]